MKREQLIQRLPVFLAAPLDDFEREQDPLVRLWMACELFEFTLRFGVAAMLSTVASGAVALDAKSKSRLREQLQLPTLGQWLEMTDLLSDRCGAAEPGQVFRVIFERAIVPLARPSDGSLGMLVVRNQLAHGMSPKRSAAAEILHVVESRIERLVGTFDLMADWTVGCQEADGMWRALRGPSGQAGAWQPSEVVRTRMRQIWREPAQLLLIAGDCISPLWPLSVFGVPVRDGEVPDQPVGALPQIYARRGKSGVDLTVLRSDKLAVSCLGMSAIEEFDRILPRTPAVDRSGTHRVAGFERQFEREFEEAVGRSRERELLAEWIDSAGRGVGVVYGGAGTGKSILMGAVSYEAISGGECDHRLAAIAFRFKRGDERCHRSAFVQYLTDELNRHLERSSGRGQTSVALACGLARDLASSHRVVLVLDGMDEIVDLDRRIIEDVIAKLAGSVHAVLCFSRPEPAVCQSFELLGAAEVFPGGLAMMHDDDIRAMVLERTGPLRRVLLRRDSECADGIRNPAIEPIVRASRGLPLYVTYVINDLINGRIELEDLDHLPPTLTAYHERLLERACLSDAGMVAPPALVLICLAGEPMPQEALSALLVEWGLVDELDDAIDLVQKAVRAIEPMLRRIEIDGSDGAFGPYHESLRQHVCESRRLHGTLKRAKRVLREAARRATDSHEMDVCGETQYLFLRNYMLRHGVFHLLDEGAIEDAIELLVFARHRIGRSAVVSQLTALNDSLDRKSAGLVRSKALLALWELLVLEHEESLVATGARFIMRHHREHLASHTLAGLELGHPITFEIGHAIQFDLRGSEWTAASALIESVALNDELPGHYSASIGLLGRFAMEPSEDGARFLRRCSQGSPYHRMGVLNALAYRAVQGDDPLRWIPDGPFWRSRWEYLRHDIEIVQALVQRHGGISSQAVSAQRRALDGVEAEYCRIQSGLPKSELDAIGVILDQPLALLGRLPQLRARVPDLILSERWLEIGRALLAHPFWQVAEVGAQVLAARYRSNRHDRGPVLDLLTRLAPLPEHHVKGDRDAAMVDLARAIVADERDIDELFERVAPFLASSLPHQRAEATLMLAQFLRPLSSEHLHCKFLDRLSPYLPRMLAESDVWAAHELAELLRLEPFVSRWPFLKHEAKTPTGLLARIPKTHWGDEIEFTWHADQISEEPGTRLVR
jgi:hypothetical protein